MQLRSRGIIARVYRADTGRERKTEEPKAKVKAWQCHIPRAVSPVPEVEGSEPGGYRCVQQELQCIAIGGCEQKNKRGRRATKGEGPMAASSRAGARG